MMVVAEAHKEKKFKKRLSDSKWYTDMWMRYLKGVGHFSEYHPATDEQDKEDGIDYWVRYPNEDEWIPIQFKLRVEVGKRDCPMVLHQPFWGCDVEYDSSDNTKNSIGRDYKGVSRGNTKYYYVAVKSEKTGLYSEINRYSSSELRKIADKAQESWAEVPQYITEDDGYETLNPKYFYKYENLTNARIRKIFGMNLAFEDEDAQIWIQKIVGEQQRKINCYIRESLKEMSVPISQSTSQRVKNLFLRWQQNHS